MQVFISWSGPRSKAIAEALEGWLAQVIQAVDPWISQDIDKGLRWGPEIAGRLESSKVGIICLTKSNLDAKWIHFEAGALSKTKDAYVCTLLLGIQPTDVEQPLAQFQHTTTDKEDIFQLLKTINRAVEGTGEKALSEAVLRKVFETYWPDLETAFNGAAGLQESTPAPSRSTAEMLQEVLEILRNQERRQSSAVQRGGTNVPNSTPIAGAFSRAFAKLQAREQAGIDDTRLRYLENYGLDNFLLDGYGIDESYLRKSMSESNSVGEFLDYISRAPGLDDAAREAIAFLYTLPDNYLRIAYDDAKRKRMNRSGTKTNIDASPAA